MNSRNHENLKVVAIIQARLGSTRLPSKVLKTILGKTLLEYQLERVKRSVLIDEIIVATTVKESDVAIVDLCRQLGIEVYRGSENDVLSRYYEAAVKYKADVVVRLTSDCPLIDPGIIDKTIQLYLDQQDEIDYCSNSLERTFPRGFDTEVFSFTALEKANDSASLVRDREHVTAYIYTNQDQFKLASFKSVKDLSYYRWTVDTEEDFELIRRILESLYPHNPFFLMKDVLELLEGHPSWLEINAYIEQKKL